MACGAVPAADLPRRNGDAGRSASRSAWPPPRPAQRGGFFLFPRESRRHDSRVASLDPKAVRRAVAAALAEDLGAGDATTLAVVPPGRQARAVVRARQPLTVAGLAFAESAFRQLSPRIRIRRRVRDGQTVRPGAVLLEIRGPARAILGAERVALNFLQRLCGIATLTHRFVRAVRGTRARILDTRKTTPGLRAFEKYAVRCGGGLNHRAGLFDMVLIKDNHLAALRDAQPNPVAAAVARARRRFPKLAIEVEADTLAQVRQALAAGTDRILLDNMTPAQVRRAVRMARGRAELEASGGVNLHNVRALARTGVDFISVGALTHSAPAVDIGLDFEAP